MNVTAEQIDKASPAELSAWIDALRSKGEAPFLYEQPWAFDLNLCAELESSLRLEERGDYALRLRQDYGNDYAVFTSAVGRCRAYLKTKLEIPFDR